LIPLNRSRLSNTYRPPRPVAPVATRRPTLLPRFTRRKIAPSRNTKPGPWLSPMPPLSSSSSSGAAQDQPVDAADDLDLFLVVRRAFAARGWSSHFLSINGAMSSPRVALRMPGECAAPLFPSRASIIMKQGPLMPGPKALMAHGGPLAGCSVRGLLGHCPAQQETWVMAVRFHHFSSICSYYPVRQLDGGRICAAVLPLVLVSYGPFYCWAVSYRFSMPGTRSVIIRFSSLIFCCVQ